MSADELRAAADRLDALADAATPGPWYVYVLGSEGYDVRSDADRRPPGRIRRAWRIARFGYEDWDTDKANAAYIAAMHPGVAKALAAWLRVEADWAAEGQHVSDALAVARAILGGDA